ncbi:glycosyl transferase [Luteimonas padinae]|uniref:Glycosyltransferase family 4 protein n=1 Tax=Luteimonas padinae TaxID=1714359 RepID=A0ABV6T0H6_9GAMM|nr:glycosyltransferase family 4 protein [Luteimonas padinae]GHD67397.1 glycosyl transferase [Luteimonas padinae]
MQQDSIGINRALVVASYPDSILKFRGPLLEAMVASGWEVHIAAPAVDTVTGLREALRSIGVALHDIPLSRTGTNPVVDIGLVLALRALMRELRPTVVLPYTIKPVIYGTIAAWMASVPKRFALVTGLGFAFTGDRQGIVKRVVSGLYRFALGRTHKMFFQNPDDERLFRELGIAPVGIPSVVVNGSGVDVAAFRVAPLPGSPIVFLLIGRLLGDKGVREFAKAARQVKALHPEVRFHAVGWIDSNPDAIAQSELDAWVADGTLEFLGKLDDVRPAIAASTVYVLPSYREGTPRTVLEAMAMGRPIITTDAPGCRETVIDGDNGFLVPVQSVDALVEAMLKFIEDPALAQRMGRRSRQIAEDKYDVHKVNAVMLREMGITRAATEGEAQA